MSSISEQDKKLFEAIEKNDIDVLKSILVDKQDVNILDENSMTPLQHAAYKGNKEMVQMLLDQGADVNLCQHKHIYTALHFAGLSGNAEVCSLLLLAGAKSNVINSVNRTPSQMAAFVGNHICTATINNFVPKSDVEYYTLINGQQEQPLLPPFLADGFHKFIMQVNIHPVKICLSLQRIAGLLDHIDEITKVLELMSSKEMKPGLEMNEVMAFKFHYLGSICREVSKQAKMQTHHGEITQTKSEIVDLFIKKLLKVNKNGDLYFMDILLKDCVRNFPFHESTLLRQMVSSLISHDSASALAVVASAINGQRAFIENIPLCSTCGEEKPEKKCANCKIIQYCDRECQRLHWFVHKKACGGLSQIGASKSLPQTPDPKEITEDMQNLLLSN